jgi:hypothetical protein
LKSDLAWVPYPGEFSLFLCRLSSWWVPCDICLSEFPGLTNPDWDPSLGKLTYGWVRYNDYSVESIDLMRHVARPTCCTWHVDVKMNIARLFLPAESVHVVTTSIYLHTNINTMKMYRCNSSSSSSSSVICQTIGPQPLPKRFLHLMRSRASSFKWQYPLLSPRSSSNRLRLLPRLLVTSIRPFIFSSVTFLEGSFYVRYDQSN